MTWLIDPQIWVSLVTLTVLEIVLGIDNLVFLAILSGRLPRQSQKRARRVGLGLALLARLALLGSIAWIISMTRPLFSVLSHPVSLRDVVLVAAGFFLLYKGTTEIHQHVEHGDEQEQSTGHARFGSIVAQIVVLDVVFSLDSVLTAVGIADHLWVMAVAIVVAILIMVYASEPLAAFIEAHPTVKMLALSFLLLIGMTLIADGSGFDVPKGYIYAAIGFSIGVEALNQLAARRRQLPESPPSAGIAASERAARPGGKPSAQ